MIKMRKDIKNVAVKFVRKLNRDANKYLNRKLVVQFYIAYSVKNNINEINKKRSKKMLKKYFVIYINLKVKSFICIVYKKKKYFKYV